MPQLAETAGKGNTRTEEDVPFLEPMSWYPPLRPPMRPKKEVFQIQDFASVDEYARQAPACLTSSFTELGDYLTHPFHSDLQQLRSIFTWIGAQNLASSKVTGSNPSPDTPLDYMKKASGGNSLYFINLFVVICRKAGIPCMTIQGTAKGLGYEPGESHALGTSLWTVVNVLSSWRFVHPHWAFKCVNKYNAGTWTMLEKDGKVKLEKTMKDEGEVQGRVEEFWFLTDPEEMNFFCHPDDPDKQLLEMAWSMKDFTNLPGMHCEYFMSPWRLLRPHTGVLETKTGKCCIDFQHPVNVQSELRYKLFFDEKKSQTKLSSQHGNMDRFVTRTKGRGGMVSLIMRLPIKGVFKIELTGVCDGTDYELGAFQLRCVAPPEETKPFPANPKNGFGFDEKVAESTGISNPSHTEGVLLVNKGKEMMFEFQVQNDVDVQPKLLDGVRKPEDLSCHVSVSRTRDQVQIGVTLPLDDKSPEYALEIFVGGKRRDGDSDKISRGGEGGHRTTDHGGTESEIVQEPELDAFSPTDIGTGLPGASRLQNALNYLLTCDKELHKESKNVMKEIHSELQDALDSSDEKLIMDALHRFEDAGLCDPVTLAKVKARQAVFSNVRQEFLTALQSHSMKKLDSALNNFLSNRLHDEKGDVNLAMEKLLNYGEKAISKAMVKGTVEDLGQALNRIRSSRVHERARSARWFRTAQQRKLEMSVGRLCSDLLDTLDVVSMLRLCDRPLSKRAMAVLKTTYLLLGEDEKRLRDRQALKAKLLENMKGKYTLMQKVKNFDASKIDKRAVIQAETEMATCSMDAAAEENSGVLRLHDWCSSMVEEIQSSDLLDEN